MIVDKEDLYMKEKRRALAVIIGIIMLFTGILPIYASEAIIEATERSDMTPEEYELMKLQNVEKCINGEKHNHELCILDQMNSLSGILSNEYSSRTVTPWCSECSCPYSLKCSRDAQEYARGSHGNCVVVYLRSRAKWICGGCKDWQWDYATSTTLQYHDCWQVHQSCSKGQYQVCTVALM